MKLLVIESDQQSRETLSLLLTQDYFDVDVVHCGEEGLFRAKQGVHDLVILASELTGRCGTDIIRRLRAEGMDTPVLLLVCGQRIEDRVTGLNAGADDCLVKPFESAELLARVRALLRRAAPSAGAVISYGGVTLVRARREVYVNEKKVHLTSKEYELLEYLILNRQQVLTREQIFDRVWGFECETGEEIVHLYIYYLRKKLAQCGLRSYIYTIRGVGYVFEGNEQMLGAALRSG